jgi:hypothetical protein
MDKNNERFLKEANCPEIQDNWKPKLGDEVFLEIPEKENKVGVVGGKGIIGTVWSDKLEVFFGAGQKEIWEKNFFVWLPRLSQIIEMMGEQFNSIGRIFSPRKFYCSYSTRKLQEPEGLQIPETKSEFGDTSELACLMALKSLRKNEPAEYPLGYPEQL